MGSFGFNKSKSKNQSTSSQDSSSENANYNEQGNQAYDYLKDSYSPGVQQGNDAMSAIRQMLFGGADQNQGFQNFRDNSGYDFQFNEGQRAANAPFAARGAYDSGARMKALTKYGQGMASTSVNDYIAQLLGLTQLGQNSGNIISDAGKYGVGAGYGTSKSHAESQSTGSSSSLGVNASFKPG